MRTSNFANLAGAFCVAAVVVLSLATSAQATLVGHWTFDEPSWNGTAGEVIDSSPTANHGRSFSGASTTPSGKIGRAGYFDGVNDYVQIPSHPTLDLDSNGSYSAWVNFADLKLPTATHWILSSASYTSGVGINQYGSNLYVYWKSTGGPQVTAANVFSTNTWYHVAVTDTSSALSLYLNGQLLATGTENSNAFLQQVLNIGGTAYMNGTIDDVAVWSNGLSVAQARSLYTVVENLGFAYNASNMQSLWDIYATQGTGTIGGYEWSYTNILPGTHNLGDVYYNNGFTYLALGATSGLVLTPPPAPEPSSMLLLGTGLLGLARYSRRHRSVVPRLV